MVGLLLSRVNELPVLSSFDGHFAEERIIGLEISGADNLSAEVNFWD